MELTMIPVHYGNLVALYILKERSMPNNLTCTIYNHGYVILKLLKTYNKLLSIILYNIKTIYTLLRQKF